MRINFKKRSLILTGFIFLLACNSADQKNSEGSNSINPDVVNNPATASSEKNENTAIPVFEFVEESHDFGVMTEGEKTTHAFRFKNTGNGDLVIRSANGSCGCTVPKYPKDPVAPGKEGVINVTFDSEGKEGKQNKTVTIIANTVPNSKVLTITADVKTKN